MESNQNSYQLKQDEKVYILNTSLLGDIIKITCKNDKEEQFTGKFTLDELKSLDAILFKINSPLEAIEFLDQALSNQKVGVKEEDIEVKINIYFAIEGQFHQIDINLEKVEAEQNFSSNDAINTVGDTFAEQYTTSSNTDQFLGQNENINDLGTQFLGTENYDNVGNNTDNVINGGEINSNDIVDNLNINNLVEGITNNQYSKSNILVADLNNNFDLGLGQSEVKYGQHSVPIPSFDTNQYLNSFENTNTEQYTSNYGVTSVEPSVVPAPTIPITTDTITDQYTNLDSNVEYTGSIAEQYDYTQNTTTNTNTNTFDINEFLNTSPNTVPPVISDNNLLKSPQVLTTNKKIEYTTDKSDSIFSSPVTFSLPKRFQNKEEPIIEPTPQIDTNIQFNPEPSFDFNVNNNINNENYNYNNYNNYNYNYGTFQSQPQPDLNLYKQSTNTFQQNAYKTQSEPIKQTQFGNKLYQNQEKHTSVVNIYKSTKPVDKYQFGITLIKDDKYPTATIEKVYKTTETKEVVETQNINDERINQLEGDTNILRNDHQHLIDKLNELTGQINLYKNQLGSLERDKSSNEVDALREENMAIKRQLDELNKLRNTSAEVQMLRNQLAELDPLRRKVAEMELIKSQLRELNDLRRRIWELDGVKAQVDEMNRLKAEVSKMNDLQNQLGELNRLKRQIADAENLRKTMEESRQKYEQDMQNLRNSQRIELLKKKIADSRYDYGTKQIKIQKEEYVTVKGDIIHNMDELEMITRKINKLNHKIILNLLYKATADSDTATAFHEKCDDANSTLVLVETNSGKRFGGFTTSSWRGDCIDKKDDEAFIFSLDKMMTYDVIQGEDAIGCYPRFGPIFLGCQIRIYDNAFSKGGTTYERGLNYNTEEDYELTDGDREFGIKEIEVYEVITQ